MRPLLVRSVIVVSLAFSGVIALQVAPAHAHAGINLGGVEGEIGWVSEPVLAGYPNAIFLELHGVRSIGESLKVEVLFGDERSPAQTFEPREEPGQFQSGILPTRAGSYSVRLFGTLGGRKVDKTYKIEDADEPTELMFPTKDPTSGQISERVDRLGTRVDPLPARVDQALSASRSAKDDGSLAKILAIIGIVLGAAALAVALLRKPKTIPTSTS